MVRKVDGTCDDYVIVVRGPKHKKFPYLLTCRLAGDLESERVDVAVFADEDDAVTAAKALDREGNPSLYSDE